MSEPQRGSTGRPRLLWIGDAVANTGFARVTHNVLAHLHTTWDVHVLGINTLGDPHHYPYPIYPARLAWQGDPWGVARYSALVTALRPDVVLVMHDPWIVQGFLEAHQVLPDDAARPPLCAYMPIDGYHVAEADALNGLALALTYTQFGAEQLAKGGYTGRLEVIPHGVDLTMYTPRDRAEARDHLGIPALNAPGVFLVGNLNRNQPRKRLDITMLGFALWQQQLTATRAYLWLHCAEEPMGWRLRHLAQYLGIEQQVILPPSTMTSFHGAEETELSWIYSAWDAQVSTTMGEGWGLATMEAMACGVPNLVPEWSALAEWPRGAVDYLLCRTTAVSTVYSVVHGVTTPEDVAQGLEALRTDPMHRLALAEAGLALVERPEFRWEAIAQRFDRALRSVLPVLG